VQSSREYSSSMLHAVRLIQRAWKQFCPFQNYHGKFRGSVADFVPKVVSKEAHSPVPLVLATTVLPRSWQSIRGTPQVSIVSRGESLLSKPSSELRLRIRSSHTTHRSQRISPRRGLL
jgi:hypothetical protein